MERALVWVDGYVQGVGFRWWASSQADKLGLTGYAENLPDGRVEIVVQGEPADVRRFIHLVVESPTTTRRPGRVSQPRVEWVDPDPKYRRFAVR